MGIGRKEKGMDKRSRQRRKEMVTQLLLEDAAVYSGRYFASVIFLVWTITRVLQVSAELLCAAQGILLIYSWHDTLMLLVIPLFLAALYMGYRWMVIFPVFMGVMLVAETFSRDLYSTLSPSCMLGARLYAFTMIVAAYGQILFPIMLVANKKTKLYFDSVRTISRQLEEEKLLAKRRQKEESQRKTK